MIDKIVNTAEMLFMKYGTKSVSMDDLASDLAISKKTLYQHIDNKSALIKRVVISYVEKEQALITDIEDRSTDALEEMMNIAHHVRFVLKNMQMTFVFELRKYHKDSWLIFEKSHMKFIQKNIQRNIIRGKEEGLYRPEVNADVISKIYVRKMLSFSDEELFPAKEYPREALFKDFFEYHIYGIASPLGLNKLEELKTYEA